MVIVLGVGLVRVARVNGVLEHAARVGLTHVGPRVAIIARDGAPAELNVVSVEVVVDVVAVLLEELAKERNHIA